MSSVKVALAINAVAAAATLAGCGDVKAGNPSITVEVGGVDAQADARKISEAALDACDIGAFGAVADGPDGVNVTVEFPDGDTDDITVSCETGEVTPR